MEQPLGVGPVERSVGYVLKQAAVALRAAMDEALRPLELTVPQYSCLEVLGQRPGISNAELARATFVTRQSMNTVLQTLETRGLVSRPATAPRGRELPASLTPAGLALLRPASTAARAVEQRMCAGLDPATQAALLDALTSCVRSLADG
ncbi:MarR family transcriptional regulator [Dactylosporangium vinaceum]|uniref:MarR family winged helix-turn-helix transcriptional regulator n=1 Tax=Dactylosporangium vinaceum TaxID=53362 RepID=A0ABV5MCX0_9ACTN|nr:MarR family transcriptional regulator [Dactylosporangium vinaceum]UAC00737.1 MarR family transcriptional regulator [Dactylosporangium vinaceum]